MATKLPAFMLEDEKVECINCGWQGIKDSMEDNCTCPVCDCADYIIELEFKEDEDS